MACVLLSSCRWEAQGERLCSHGELLQPRRLRFFFKGFFKKQERVLITGFLGLWGSLHFTREGFATFYIFPYNYWA